MATIGIFDSGIGGLSVLKEVRRLMPQENFLYFSDNAYCPYGDKEQDFILDRAREITDFLIFRGADVIVVACNTATAAAIATLREEYSHPDERVRMVSRGRIDHVKFIGMEPAVKPAALGTKSGVIGVLATAGTLAASKYLNTKGQFLDEAIIEEHVGEGFVELVESGEWNGPHAREVVRASLQPLLDKGADRIVLGCTHYPFLLPVIQEIAGPDVQVIDPAPSVARQLKRVMEEEKIPCGGTGRITLYASGDREALERTFALI